MKKYFSFDAFKTVAKSKNVKKAGRSLNDVFTVMLLLYKNVTGTSICWVWFLMMSNLKFQAMFFTSLARGI